MVDNITTQVVLLVLQLPPAEEEIQEISNDLPDLLITDLTDLPDILGFLLQFLQLFI